MSLDEFFGPAKEKPQSRGCHVCGGDSVLSLQVRVYGDEARRNKSRTHRFCAEHGIQRYEQMQAVLEER